MSYSWVSTPSAPLTKTGVCAGYVPSSQARRRSQNFSVRRRTRTGLFRSPLSVYRMCAAPENLHIQVVTVPDEGHMLTPGEVRQVALDYFLFHSILQTGSTLFGCINVADWRPSADCMVRGSLLSILSVKNVVPDDEPDTGDEAASPAPPKIMVECKCSGRFDVHRVTEDSILTPSSASEAWKLMRAECIPVRDWSCWDIEDRRNVAAQEWKAWESCREVASLMRKLHPPTRNKPLVEQELAVWAPKKYDKEITEDEWAQTPSMTRDVWCQRAESFSFGILRCMESEEEVMRKARELTNTANRLNLAVESIERRRALVQAQLSLKDVFRG